MHIDLKHSRTELFQKRASWCSLQQELYRSFSWHHFLIFSDQDIQRMLQKKIKEVQEVQVQFVLDIIYVVVIFQTCRITIGFFIFFVGGKVMAACINTAKETLCDQAICHRVKIPWQSPQQLVCNRTVGVNSKIQQKLRKGEESVSRTHQLGKVQAVCTARPRMAMVAKTFQYIKVCLYKPLKYHTYHCVLLMSGTGLWEFTFAWLSICHTLGQSSLLLEHKHLLLLFTFF